MLKQKLDGLCMVRLILEGKVQWRLVTSCRGVNLRPILKQKLKQKHHIFGIYLRVPISRVFIRDTSGCCNMQGRITFIIPSVNVRPMLKQNLGYLSMVRLYLEDKEQWSIV